MLVLDLFSGIGGFSLAARWSGLDTAAFCEIAPFCQQVLAKNFPGVEINGDITTFDARRFRGRIFLLAGGFPCQDLSQAGKGAGLIKGERSGLWFEMLRIIRECEPAYILVENVRGIRTKEGEDGEFAIDTVLRGMEESGYACETFLVGADDIGASHERKRIWIVGYRQSHAGRLLLGNERSGDTDAGRSGKHVAGSLCSQRRQSIKRRHVTNGTNTRREETAGRFEFLHETLADCESTILQFARSSRKRRSGFTNHRVNTLADTYRAGRQEFDGTEPDRQERLQRDFSASPAYDGAPVANSGRTSQGIQYVGEPCVSEQSNGGSSCASVAISNSSTKQYAPDKILSCGTKRITRSETRQLRQRISPVGNRLPVFPPKRNEYASWSAVARVDTSYMPCTERKVHKLADGVSLESFRGSESADEETPEENEIESNEGATIFKGREYSRTRNAILKALGNSIVPQIAYAFIQAILNFDRQVSNQ